MKRTDEKDQAFLDIAARLSDLSTCDRAAVGALIVNDGRCVSWGYNGAPPGAPHCDENFHGLRTSEFQVQALLEEYLVQNGCNNATHAEANAIAFAARQGISTAGSTLYVTISPCLVCARLLLAAGIVRIVWTQLYRDESGLNLLAEAGVELL